MAAIKLKAVTPKNQSNMNKAIAWGEKYNALNRLRDIADGEHGSQSKQYKQADKLCADAWEKHLDYLHELPKGEQKRVEKFCW